MNLYKKYRPTTFDDLVGLNNVDALRGIITKEAYKYRREYLFYSNDGGVGKTSSAIILSKAILCSNVDDRGNPCNSCDSCLSIDSNTNLDVKQINCADFNSVDKVKTLIEISKYKPVSGKYRIMILDEVHRMSQVALTEFLIPLEFYDSDTIFIFTTTDVKSLKQTFVSRVLPIKFNKISKDSMIRYLRMVADEEGISISNNDLASIAIHSDGSMRQALSYLELYHLSGGLDIIGINEKFLLDVLRFVIFEDDRSKMSYILNSYGDDMVKKFPLFINSIMFSDTDIFNDDFINNVSKFLTKDNIRIFSKTFLRYKPSNMEEFIMFLPIVEFTKFDDDADFSIFSSKESLEDKMRKLGFSPVLDGV